MRKLLKEDEKRKEKELLVMRVEKGVYNILVKPSTADVGAASDGGDRHGGPADRGGTVAVTAAHQSPTWMSTLTRR
eukprot:3844357-Amphidinium_carterae.1